MAGMEGLRLGSYELSGRIGGGGMAEVYRARQLSAFGREVAIKVIRAGLSEDATFRERFLREAQAISRLSHPHILPLIEFGEDHTPFGEDHALLYLVMPLVREGTLRDLLKQYSGPLPLEEAVPLFVQLCDAVQYAHDEGFIHRDIKPQNVLLHRRTHVLLADFGIARDTSESQHMTTTGAGMGTVEYMAPEQAIGQATKLSDIYSLGIVLYQLLTGTVPYSGSTPYQVLNKHIHAPLPDPRLLNRSLPNSIVQILQSALAKDPERRFQSALALGHAVRQMRPDAAPDLLTSTGPTHPPIQSALRPKPSLLTQTTWHGQNFRESLVEPELPELPSDSAPSRPGSSTGRLPLRRELLPPPGEASAMPQAEEDELSAGSTQGGRTARTAPGRQQRGPSHSPVPLARGPSPQPIAPRRERRRLRAALLVALLLIITLSSFGVAAELGLFTPQSSSRVAQGPPVTTAPQTANVPGGVKSTAVPTGTAKPSPLPTNTPKPGQTPTLLPSPTPDAFPNIQGNYQGTYTPLGSYAHPLTLQIVQSGKNLTGTATENGNSDPLSGTIDSSGSLTIFAGTLVLNGSLVSPGHLSGSYSNSGEIGYWDVTLS